MFGSCEEKKKKQKQNHDVSHCLLTSNPLERNCVHSSFSLCSPYYSLKIVLQSYLQTYSSVSIPWETLKRLQALSVAARCCKWMSLAIHRVPGTHVATRTYGCSSPLATGWCVCIQPVHLFL